MQYIPSILTSFPAYYLQASPKKPSRRFMRIPSSSQSIFEDMYQTGRMAIILFMPPLLAIRTSTPRVYLRNERLTFGSSASVAYYTSITGHGARCDVDVSIAMYCTYGAYYRVVKIMCASNPNPRSKKGKRHQSDTKNSSKNKNKNKNTRVVAI